MPNAVGNVKGIWQMGGSSPRRLAVKLVPACEDIQRSIEVGLRHHATAAFAAATTPESAGFDLLAASPVPALDALEDVVSVAYHRCSAPF
jgi:hypothetical protein